MGGGRFDPFAMVGEAGVGANSANQGVRGGSNVSDLLKHDFEHGANVARALREKSKSVGMAINNGSTAEIKIPGNAMRAAPADEIHLDHFAFGMATDHAFATMQAERRRGRVCDHSFASSLLKFAGRRFLRDGSCVGSGGDI